MADPVRFHLSLNVADLDRSVAFFRALFGMEPAKLRADYAKFEPSEPPLVLSLEPAKAVASSGPLNHVGLRLPDAKSLVAMQERLERHGIRTQREEGVECCYAKQTKFWLHDPDGTLWEVYTFDGDIDHRGAGQPLQAIRGTVAESAAMQPVPVVVDWEHRMNELLPDRIPLADATVREVRLRGTLNMPLAEAALRQLCAEMSRVLRPGGRIFVHVLAGDVAVETPGLGGAAAAVQKVPHEREPIDLLESCGFIGITLLKYDAKPCFVRDGVAMREMQIEAFAPSARTTDEVEVLYRGPLREVRDDGGRVYPRGERVIVLAQAAERLRASSLAGQFTIFGPPSARTSGDRSCSS